MKGIILAGGKGTRLFPTTKSVSKQLLPIYDKPLIYYPLSVLMLAGIREILIITTKNDLESYRNLLGNGENFGINIQYKIQPSPDGLAQAFIIGEEFIGSDSVSLILGDNIFYGQNFSEKLDIASKIKEGAKIFAYHVRDPERFGVVEFNKKMKVKSIEEKPILPKSNYAIVGLYFYDNSVIEKAKSLSPSKRGELEITDLNQLYLNEQNLEVELLGRGYAWLDTGTPESMLEASQFISTVENSQNLKIACLEEIALKKGWVSKKNLLSISHDLEKTAYGKYIKSLLTT